MDEVGELTDIMAPAGHPPAPPSVPWAELRRRCRAMPSSGLARLVRKGANQFGGRRQVALNRLGSAICRLSVEAESRTAESRTAETTASDRSTGELVLRLLDEAAERLERREVNEGWASFNSAQRASLAWTSEEERRVLAASLRAEVGQKLTDWRKKAALEVLRGEPVDPGADAPRTRAPTVEQLRVAQGHLDERSTNVYRRLDLYAKVLYFFLWSLIAVLVGLYFAVRESWITFSSSPSLTTTGSLVSIMLLGALGSLLSAALTRVTPGQARIPELIEGWLGALLRPVLGAASAVALVVVIESGMLSAVQAGEDRIFVWAIAAGFSERLLRRSIESVAASAEAARSPTEVSAGRADSP